MYVNFRCCLFVQYCAVENVKPIHFIKSLLLFHYLVELALLADFKLSEMLVSLGNGSMDQKFKYIKISSQITVAPLLVVQFSLMFFF